MVVVLRLVEVASSAVIVLHQWLRSVSVGPICGIVCVEGGGQGVGWGHVLRVLGAERAPHPWEQQWHDVDQV